MLDSDRTKQIINIPTRIHGKTLALFNALIEQYNQINSPQLKKFKLTKEQKSLIIEALNANIHDGVEVNDTTLMSHIIKSDALLKINDAQRKNLHQIQTIADGIDTNKYQVSFAPSIKSYETQIGVILSIVGGLITVYFAAFHYAGIEEAFTWQPLLITGILLAALSAMAFSIFHFQTKRKFEHKRAGLFDDHIRDLGKQLQVNANPMNAYEPNRTPISASSTLSSTDMIPLTKKKRTITLGRVSRALAQPTSTAMRFIIITAGLAGIYWMLEAIPQTHMGDLFLKGAQQHILGPVLMASIGLMIGAIIYSVYKHHSEKVTYNIQKMSLNEDKTNSTALEKEKLTEKKWWTGTGITLSAGCMVGLYYLLTIIPGVHFADNILQATQSGLLAPIVVTVLCAIVGLIFSIRYYWSLKSDNQFAQNKNALESRIDTNDQITSTQLYHYIQDECSEDFSSSSSNGDDEEDSQPDDAYLAVEDGGERRDTGYSIQRTNGPNQ